MPTHLETASTPEAQRELLIYYLNKIYDGKTYLHDCLPDIIMVARHQKLRFALEELQHDVKNQIERMQEIYRILDVEPTQVVDAPIKSIIKNACELRNAPASTILNDIDTLIHMQLVEHVNIISYRMLKKLAGLLRYEQIWQLLLECFDESRDDDALFVEITEEYLTRH